MERTKTHYICQNCGYSSLRWAGKCPSCGEWDTLAEERIQPAVGRDMSTAGENSRPYFLDEISADAVRRIRTGINEFDRLLGGGIVPGAVILLGGEPGIGKSTLLLQTSCALSSRGVPVLYVTGEESIEQTKLRAERLGISKNRLLLLNGSNVENVIRHIGTAGPHIAVIDSIQTLYHPFFSSAPGSVAQVRECAGMLSAEAKKKSISLFLVGHVTKSGSIAGPRVVEHIVDTVLYFEGDTHNRYRILRTLKNRFGSTDEIGIFSMREDGLREVANPSDIFLTGRDISLSGTVVTASVEGSRPILVELQALVSPAVYGMPERRAIGMDYKRLSVLLAVMEKRLGIRLQNQDVFVSAAGGIKLGEPAVDLAAAIAVISSFRDIPVMPDMAVLGEIGLGGEIRPVPHIERRISEIKRLGFKKVVYPSGNEVRSTDNGGMRLIPVDTLAKAAAVLGEQK